MPWDRLGRYLLFIQFPWRLFIMSASLLSTAAGIVYGYLTGGDEDYTEIRVSDKNADPIVINTGAAILAALLIVCGIMTFDDYGRSLQGYYDYSDDYYSYKPYTSNVIAGEWLPDAVNDSDSLTDDSEKMTDDNGKTVGFNRIKNEINADISEKYEYLDIPFVYYKGYAAQLTTDSGERISLKVDGSGHNGLCRVYMNGNDNGNLRVYYKGTKIMNISYLISMVTIIAVTAVYMNKKKKAASGKEEHE